MNNESPVDLIKNNLRSIVSLACQNGMLYTGIWGAHAANVERAADLLQARVVELEAQVAALQAEVVDRKLQIDALRPDATRYNFLRDGDRAGLKVWDGEVCACGDEDVLFGKNLDLALDDGIAAMATRRLDKRGVA